MTPVAERPEPDWAALADAGLLDPEDAGAADRRELLAYLHDEGATQEEMVAAHAAGRLFGLIGDRRVRPGGDRHSLAVAAGLAGTGVAEVARLWRALGLPGADLPLDPDAPLLADVDLAALPAWVRLREVLGDEATLGLARVLGGAAARLADATGSALRRLGTLDVATASEATTARSYADAVDGIPGLVAAFEAAFRHQVELARVQSEQAGEPGSDGSMVRLAVGFTDLTGFTRLSARLDHASLAVLLDTFADVASDVVRRNSGRVVKLVGDAVLFVAPRPADAARACLELLSAAAGYGLSGRAGAAYGPVLDRDGDVFGPVVNLAARLVAQAPDAGLLVTVPLAEALAGSGLVVQEVPALTVRGYDEPVPAARVHREGTGPPPQ